MLKKLEEMKNRYHQLEKQLGDISTSLNHEEKGSLMKEFASLGKTVLLYKKYQEGQKDIQTYEEMLIDTTESQEFKKATQKELSLLKTKQNQLWQELKMVLIPKDPLDEKNIIMEIRQATGGDEAGLFCENLWTMYSRYADKKNWKIEVLSVSAGNRGGFKEIIFSVSGSFIYQKLKYESGVHRVQRVPKTETAGRVHTSTVTVAVLPSMDSKAVQIQPMDIRVDTFRSSGAGGQHVNTTDSAVRVVHLPTQITVQCQDEKSQHANKEKAMKVLYARIYDHEMNKKKQAESQSRLSQIGTGKRSEKVRTYNFPQSRVTDHRINLTLYNLEQIIAGDLDHLLSPLEKQARENSLTQLE